MITIRFLIKHIWKTFLFLLYGSIVCSCSQVNEPAPNIIMILVDDWGWTDAGCYGSEYYETPNIDLLARKGIRFTDAYAACTVCSPTRAAMMTGKYPARLNITDWITGHKYPFAKFLPPDWDMKLEPKEITIAEALKEKGYATCHTGKWHLGPDSTYWPENQGFDLNLGGHSSGAPFLNKEQGYNGYFTPYGNPRLEDGPPGEYLTDRLTDEAVGFIRRHSKQPFFLYLAHYAVHTPLQAHEEIIRKYENKQDSTLGQNNPVYAAMIESLDISVGRIMEILDELGLEENTTIFITGDNGGLELSNVTDNAPLREGKGSSYEGGVRVPLIVAGSAVTAEGSLCREPVITCDFFPTIAEMAGIRELPANIDGISIRGLLQNPEQDLERDAIYWHYPHYHPGGARPYAALRSHNFKLIEFYETGALELYNLEEDISESNNLAGEMPEKARELHGMLQSWRREVAAQMPLPNPDYDPARPGYHSGAW